MGTGKTAEKRTRRLKSNKRGTTARSRKRFWISIGVLTGLIVLVLYIEFLADKKPPAWPQGHTVYGVDVSRYQKNVDWAKVRDGEISFAFVKATEGISLKDANFEQNWNGAAAAGIIKGAYHFYLPSIDPKKQANNFISTVKLVPGDMPPVLDIEARGKKPIEQFREDLKVWLTEVENAYGVKPIIYTGYKFYVDYLAGHFDDHHLWIAHYKVPKLKISKDHKTKLAFWQHTDEGVVSGIEGDVDCNVFFGSMRDLKSVCIPIE